MVDLSAAATRAAASRRAQGYAADIGRELAEEIERRLCHGHEAMKEVARQGWEKETAQSNPAAEGLKFESLAALREAWPVTDAQGRKWIRQGVYQHFPPLSSEFPSPCCRVLMRVETDSADRYVCPNCANVWALAPNPPAADEHSE
jgi:hypothetical protein